MKGIVRSGSAIANALLFFLISQERPVKMAGLKWKSRALKYLLAMFPWTGKQPVKIVKNSQVT